MGKSKVVKSSVPAVLRPSAGLLVKLASIAVHTDEILSPSGHQFDLGALRTVAQDPEVAAWLTEMNKLGLIPVKR